MPCAERPGPARHRRRLSRRGDGRGARHPRPPGRPISRKLSGLSFRTPKASSRRCASRTRSLSAPRTSACRRGEIAERVDWALEAVGLSELPRPEPLPALGRREAAGGDRRDAGDAAPQVLALDEPTANLDPGGKAAVFSVLLRLAQERGITIVLATQDVERAQRYAGRVVVLHEGRIARMARPAQSSRGPANALVGYRSAASGRTGPRPDPTQWPRLFIFWPGRCHARICGGS